MLQVQYVVSPSVYSVQKYFTCSSYPTNFHSRLTSSYEFIRIALKFQNMFIFLTLTTLPCSSFNNINNNRRSSTKIFSVNGGQKWLENEVVEQFKRNIGTLRCEEARFSTVSRNLDGNW